MFLYLKQSHADKNISVHLQ